MENKFDLAIDKVLKHEGGFTADERDNGNLLPDGRKGSTNLGVTQVAWENYLGHPVTWNDMKALTPEIVKPFYKKLYWDRCYCDKLPSGLDYLMLDFSINAGTGRAVKLLQESLGCVADGVIGPNTMSEIQKTNAESLINKFSEEKIKFYRTLKSYPTFGKGWENRVEAVRKEALELVIG